MSDIFELYGICISTAILLIFFSTQFDIISVRRTVIHRTPASIRALLDPPSPSMDTLLRSRASPNARLIRAFSLSNTFVSPDPTIHGKFLRKSRSLLQAANRDWGRFNGIALQAVDSALPDLPTPFHIFVRSVTLRVTLVGLLDPDADMTSLGSNDVDLVTNLITDLWILSKKSTHIPEHLLEMLNDRLRRLLPDQAAYPNPLDFVIPTWETLWRVVAVTLVHVDMNAAARRAFQDLSDNPDRAQFEASKLEGTSPSVENYISESLRLHPPVRHITRHIFSESRLTTFLPRFLASRIPPRIDIHVADIESAQRSALWESHSDSSPPETYDAARFLREPAASEVLAFGAGPLKCAAMTWAPMAAAVIVAAILNRVDGVTHYIVRGDRIGGREGWDGWMVRKAA
ncbi:hypothetical protein MVEN_01071500 [Mycena venus]|uniref:Cytochrome P450 n=1 Tax=Mycena venus TaxID=2733690 RepID=A0A8H6Y5X0_9AGAR|nr:hypothetical protein MVEN_01071500 [Mycena venus]